ncbi:DUF3093 domain-containing protein [Gordonia sp. VNQ95]|uniref:DUF3093 domain-containing protein n=1 Tax=Gordonia TaxID=2053 RepID=UPI0032B40297
MTADRSQEPDEPGDPDDADSPDDADTAEDTDSPEDAFIPTPIPDNPGEVLFYEPGGSWWVVAVGPVLIAAVLGMEIAGPGQVHWLVIGIFGLIVVGFSVIQVVAARKHVTVELTETTLQQGTKILALADIDEIHPANNGSEHQKWESAPALGELHGVPRRRTGVGVTLADGSLAQAWARDVERFRNELTEAHLAVKLGLPPRGTDS